METKRRRMQLVTPVPLRGKYGEGKSTTVDPKYYDAVKALTPHVSDRGYAYVTIEGVKVYLHTFIMAMEESKCPPDKDTIDHINRNKLDNTFTNLRWTTVRTQNTNQGIRKDNTSGYKGVSKWKDKWKVRIRLPNGVRVHIGVAVTPEEGRGMRDAALVMYGLPPLVE
jgi:hypothetical protein